MKFAVCNEIFTGWPWEKTCRFLKQAGCDGVEIAPMTFAESVTDIPAAKRAEIRRTAADNGLEVASLHMLMYSPKGLHINAPEPAVRQRAVEYLKALIEFAGSLGCTTMVYGSPPSRNVHPSLSYRQAREHMRESLLKCLDLARDRGVTLCIEPLPGDCTHLFASVEAAFNFVCDVGHPNFGLMVDCKAMTNEARPVADNIRVFGPHIRHVHANDNLGVVPGAGKTDFAPILAALREVKFDRYISLEQFKYEPDAAAVVPGSLKYLKGL
jgi:sugar phosphate isomerase/epimerase